MDFFDPHFHIWDISEDTTSGHDPAILFPPGGATVYTAALYEAEFETLPPHFKHVGGAFLEAVSVCHVDTPGTDPKYTAACVAEAKWAAAQLALSSKTYVLVPTAVLEDPKVEETLDTYAAMPTFRGIRQIVNHEPSWPRNGKDHLGDPMDMPQWASGLALLAQKGGSFDLQCNPHQFIKFAKIYETVPDMTVVINHLGCPRLQQDLIENPDIFFDGLKALAKFPNCYIKISMLCYIDPDWDQNQVVTDAVKRVIEIFGTERCFFASNFPVDVKDKWPADRLFPAFQKLVADLDADAQARLFAGNARKAYRAA